jgi:hypothetical protein
MNYIQFVREFAPIMQMYGADVYPKVALELMHKKTQDLDLEQCREMITLVLETARFAPKVPDIIECANIVRARHREGIRGDGAGEEGPRTPGVGARHLAEIIDILGKKGRGA